MALQRAAFRGCSGELNLAPRSYHSGDFEEVGWILGRIRERAARPVLAVGVSLGGNALLRWAEEAGSTAATVVRAVAAISAPVDLTAAGAVIDRGFNWLVYSRMFLRTMKPRALAKWRQHPGLFDRERLIVARTLRDFDDCFTAPLHGFAGVDDYWRRASAKPHLQAIRVPALVLNARNDPLVPGASLPGEHEVGPYVTLWQPDGGGHVGFAAGRFPGHVHPMPNAVCDWLGAAARTAVECQERSFDHVVGDGEQIVRDLYAECLRSLQTSAEIACPDHATNAGEKFAGVTPLSSIVPPPESASKMSPSAEVPSVKVWPERSRRLPSANKKPLT
jgi:hypothetical protein